MSRQICASRGTPPAEPEQPRRTEGVTQTGNANWLEMMRAIMEETLNKNNEKINTKIDTEITVVRREIAEVHERCEKHSQDLQRTREEIDGRINNIVLTQRQQNF